MNAKTKDGPTLDASADGDAALLAQYGFDLPERFVMHDPNGGVIQEREPAYLCRADGFYGRGRAGTWYEEGAIILADFVPNEHLEPLNRAAALKWAKWHQSLPINRVAIDVGDLSEAAHMLAKNPQVTDLDPLKYQEAVTKLAVELKLRREGKNARDLPGIGHNFAPQSGGKAPPILGAKTSDMSMRGPGLSVVGPDAAQLAASGVRQARAPNATVPPLGGSVPAR